MIEYSDKEIALALRTEALIGTGKYSSLLRLAADRIEDNGRSITAGQYTINRWDTGYYWFYNNDTGEGMALVEKAVLELFEALWKEMK